VAEPVGKELVFMGKITRFVAHEMTNILAAVGENAALIQDVLSHSASEAVSTRERIARAFRTIEHQIARGVDLASRLNRFAHDADETKTAEDLNAMLLQIGSFAERLARLKGVGIRVVPSDQPLNPVGNPMSIQMAIFDCLEFIMDHLGSCTTVVIRSRRVENGTAEVAIFPEDTSQVVGLDINVLCSLPQWTALEQSIERAGGKLVAEKESGKFVVVFG
jgi:signal transduction histidine kinase